MLAAVSKRTEKTPEAASIRSPREYVSEGESPVKQATQHRQAKAAEATRPNRLPDSTDEEEQILRAATIYLIRKVGGLFVATGLREEHDQRGRRWIITVTLRYPTGQEGYVGELLYDGKEFTLLTEESVIDERVRQIAADPQGIRQWNEFRTSTLRTGKA